MASFLRTSTLLGATLAMGLMAGVFGLYAHSIMRGLGTTDDRTFVSAFQALDRAILNPLFLATFVGALLLTGAAAFVQWRGDERSVLPWTLTALGLYLAVVVITAAVNVPANDAIKAAGDPDGIGDLSAVRAAFDESRWAGWNWVRAVATTVAFVCLAWGLVLHGRATADTVDRVAGVAVQQRLAPTSDSSFASATAGRDVG
jgi:uncharacterized membrane protein